MGQWNTWDITKMAKEWYTLENPNANNGVEISSILPPEPLAGVRFISSDGQSHDKPYSEVSYRNFIGEEPYWSYTSHGAGLRGSGKVNNYAGTLSVSEHIISYSGSRNPISVTNTYNNSNYNLHANSKIHLQKFLNGYPHSSSTGHGFTLDFNQIVYKLTPEDLQYLDIADPQDYKYLFIDGDGTWHYFKEITIEHKDDQENIASTQVKITDEDGMGYTLTEGDELQITDKGGNSLTFFKPYASDICYSLKNLCDFNGNTTNYIYDYQQNTQNSKISRIEEAPGRTTHVSYENGKVSEITQADGTIIKFSYNGEKLDSIIYPDGLKTGYNYDEFGRLERVWTNAGTGSSVEYKYASNSAKSTNFLKIRSVTEYGSQNADPKSEGNSVYFDYEINQTKITNKTSNLDVNYHENSQIYQFDHDGRVTGIIDANGEFYGFERFKYNQDIGTKRHKIAETSQGPKIVHNLLKNSSATDEMNHWTTKDWGQDGNPTSKITVSETHKNLGAKSFKVDNTANPSWPIAEQKISIAPSKSGRKFTLSADVKIDGNLAGGSGANPHLAAFQGETQTSGDEYSEWLFDTQNDWRRISVTASVPAGSDTIKCYFGVKNSTGTAYFDCLQLEENEFASDYNMIQNSDFQGDADVWTGVALSNSDNITNHGFKILRVSIGK